MMQILSTMSLPAQENPTLHSAHGDRWNLSGRVESHCGSAASPKNASSGWRNWWGEYVRWIWVGWNDMKHQTSQLAIYINIYYMYTHLLYWNINHIPIFSHLLKILQSTILNSKCRNPGLKWQKVVAVAWHQICHLHERTLRLAAGWASPLKKY